MTGGDDSGSLPKRKAPPREAWPDVLARLARTFGIADVEALEDVLDEARHIAKYADWTLIHLPEGYAPVVGMPDRPGGLSAARHVKYHQRLLKLVRNLREALEDPDGCLELKYCDLADHLGFALRDYEDWLAAVRFTSPPARRGQPSSESSVFVAELAKAWPELTGEKPTAWRDNIEGKPGGRFFRFVEAACKLMGFDAPSASTVHRVLTSHNSGSGSE